MAKIARIKIRKKLEKIVTKVETRAFEKPDNASFML